MILSPSPLGTQILAPEAIVPLAVRSSRLIARHTATHMPTPRWALNALITSPPLHRWRRSRLFRRSGGLLPRLGLFGGLPILLCLGWSACSALGKHPLQG